MRFVGKYFVKPVSIFLGIYMMNLSIDATDMEGRFDPAVNEIESVVELVYEVVLEKGDVLPETDEPDPETESCFFFLDHIIPVAFQLKSLTHFATRLATIHVNEIYRNPSLTIQPPPPKG